MNSSFTANNAVGESGAGGAVIINSGRAFFSDSIFAQNVSHGNGGAIELAGGSLTIFDSTLGGSNGSDGNVALGEGDDVTGNGGAIHISEATGSGLIISDISIANNVAAGGGGGLWLQADSTALIRRSDIIDNVAQGEMEDNGGGGGVFNNGGTLRLRASNISNNTTEALFSGGGGILSAGGLLSVIDTSVSDNQASGHGGGIEVLGGQMFVRGATIDGNLALFPGLPDVADGVDGNGGGISVSATDSTIFVGDTSITDNGAGGDGGGIWNEAGSTFRIADSEVSNNTAFGDDFFSGIGEGRGGGIFNNGGSMFIRDTAIEGNQAQGAFGNGGGIQTTGDDGFVFVLGSTIAGNQANVRGGGIDVDGGRLNLIDSIIGGEAEEDQNSVKTVFLEGENDIEESALLEAFGGGLFLSRGTVLVRGGEIRNNTAETNGGGIWVEGRGTLAINNATVADHDKGGIINYDGEVTLQNSVVTRNTSDAGGGLCSHGGFVGIVDSVFSENTATRGGGIFLGGGTLVFQDSTLTRNEADRGGGLYAFPFLAENSANFSNSVVSENIANNEGGAFWIKGNSTLRLLNGTVVSGNESGVNTANGSGSGGGVLNNGATVNVVNSTISGNFAVGNGGGIQSRADSITRITNSTVSQNSGELGGGVFNAGTGIFRDS